MKQTLHLTALLALLETAKEKKQLHIIEAIEFAIRNIQAIAPLHLHIQKYGCEELEQIIIRAESLRGMACFVIEGEYSVDIHDSIVRSKKFDAEGLTLLDTIESALCDIEDAEAYIADNQ